jgi:hypothetical protein
MYAWTALIIVCSTHHSNVIDTKGLQLLHHCLYQPLPDTSPLKARVHRNIKQGGSLEEAAKAEVTKEGMIRWTPYWETGRGGEQGNLKNVTLITACYVEYGRARCVLHQVS